LIIKRTYFLFISLSCTAAK